MLQNYNWNINNWLNKILGRLWRRPQPLALLKSLLVPMQDLANELSGRSITWRFQVLYSSQQLALQSMLNKLFDPTLSRIRIVTVADLVPDTNIYHDSEFDPAQALIYHDSELDIAPIIYHDSEDLAADYLVYVPTSLSASNAQIDAWISRYNIATKLYTIIYE
jgi:hypothetical protein